MLAGGSVLLTLAVVEAGARLWLAPDELAALPHVGLDDQEQNRLRWLERRKGGIGDLPFDRHDALLGWEPSPNLARRRTVKGAFDVMIHTTADGLRGREAVPRARHPGLTRIAALGCSQTFAAEVEDDETWIARVGHELRDVEALNFGVHGYGTDQIVLRYERDGRPYRPDVVVLGFAYYHLQRNLDDFRFFAKPRFARDPTGGELRLLNVPVPTPDAYAAITVPPRPWTLLDSSVLLRAGWARVLRRREQTLYRADSDAWMLGQEIIGRLASAVHEDGAHLVLVNVEDDAPQLEAALAALAQAHDATFVNAGRVLRELRRSGKQLRIARDPHWSAEGHAIIARELTTALCGSRIVPPEACADATARTRATRAH